MYVCVCVWVWMGVYKILCVRVCLCVVYKYITSEENMEQYVFHQFSYGLHCIVHVDN